MLSRVLDVPEKFAVVERIAISIGFGTVTVLGTWLWTKFERRRGRW